MGNDIKEHNHYYERWSVMQEIYALSVLELYAISCQENRYRQEKPTPRHMARMFPHSEIPQEGQLCKNKVGGTRQCTRIIVILDSKVSRLHCFLLRGVQLFLQLPRPLHRVLNFGLQLELLFQPQQLFPFRNLFGTLQTLQQRVPIQRNKLEKSLKMKEKAGMEPQETQGREKTNKQTKYRHTTCIHSAECGIIQF